MATITAAQGAALTKTAQGISDSINANRTAINGASSSQTAALSGGLSKASAGLTAYAKSGGGSSSTPTPTAPITTAAIAPTTPITLPTAPTPINPGPITLAGTPALDAIGMKVKDNQYVYDPTKSATENAVGQSNQNGMKNLQDYMQGLSTIQPKNTEADYAAREKAAGIEALRSNVNNTTAQINEIQKAAQAANLSLEGTGRGQTTTFLGGEQARINREAAIRVLPLQAQLDAAQGNLQSAIARVDKLFAYHQDDVKNA